jgi:hypothetical protein
VELFHLLLRAGLSRRTLNNKLRAAADRTDQARLSGDAIRIASAEQAEWNLTQAAIDEAAEKESEAAGQ